MPSPPARYTLFPYTTLFRSGNGVKTNRVPYDTRAQDITFKQLYDNKVYDNEESAWKRVGQQQRYKYSRNSGRSEEHTSELQSRRDLVCRLLLEKKKQKSEK